MHISNGTNLAVCNYRRTVEAGAEFQHIVEWYRHLLAQQKANRFKRAA